MNKTNRILTFLLAVSIVFTLASPAIAASISKGVTLYYRDIKITLNGSEVTPTDVNGNYVEPFIIDGTTYLPVRGVANALGLDVGWDEATSTVSLETPALDPINGYVMAPDIIYSTSAEQNGLSETGMCVDGVIVDSFTLGAFSGFYINTAKGTVAMICLPGLSGLPPQPSDAKTRVYFLYAGWSDKLNCPAGYYIQSTDTQNAGGYVFDVDFAKSLIS